MNKESFKNIVIITIVIALTAGAGFLVKFCNERKPEKAAVGSEDAYTKEIAEYNASFIVDQISLPGRSRYNDWDVKIVESDTPENLKEKNYIVLRGRAKSEVWEIADGISSVPDLSMERKWTIEDYNNIDVVVFAESVFQSAKYKEKSTGRTVTKSSEGVYLYFYNTKTKTYFLKDLLYSKKLPEKTTDSKSYRHSVGEIGQRVKMGMGRFVFTWWMALFLIVLIVGVFIVVNILKSKLREKKAQRSAPRD